MHAFRDELPRIEVTISSKHSPQLADGLDSRRLDAALMRPEEGHPDLVYKLLISEPLIAVLPSDHRLASRETISPQDLVGERFIGMADQAPVLRKLIEDYFRRSQVELIPAHRVEYLSMAMSVVARNFLTWSVTSRPLAGEAPSIDLVLGYHKANTSHVMELLLSRIEELLQSVSRKSGSRRDG